MKARISNLYAILMLVLLATLIQAPFAVDIAAQANLRQPTLSNPTLLSVVNTAGTINNGGHAVAISAATTSASANRTDCAAPTYTTCGFIIANSSGTVSSTTSLATASASGTTILAIYESDATKITKMSFPQQNGQLTQAAVGSMTGAHLITPDIGAATGQSLTLGTSGATAGTVVLNNATTGTITLQPATGALSSSTATFPVGAITVPGTVFNDCAVASACSATNKSVTMKVAMGETDALNAASPAIATVTGMPAFTGTEDYRCTATLRGTSAAGATGALEVNNVSSSSFVITAGNGVSAKADWICVGW